MPSSPVKTTAAAKSPRAWLRRDEAGNFWADDQLFVGQWSRHHLARALPRAQPARRPDRIFRARRPLLFGASRSLRIAGWAPRALYGLGSSSVTGGAAIGGCRCRDRQLVLSGRNCRL